MKNQIKRILISETNVPEGLEIITRLKSFSELRNGIFNSLERLKKKYTGALFYYENQNSYFAKAFLERNPDIKIYANEEIDLKLEPENFTSWKLISNTSRVIEEDLELFEDKNKYQKKFKVNKFKVFGKSKHLYIHPSSTIYPHVVFDTSNGPIIIDKDTVITSFSFIEGPCYISDNCKIDAARITGGSIIGSYCRIGGEVENSIFEDFSNKHHEGFVGHSHIGSWVNFGALATTSDLKNNYGVVKIHNGVKSLSTDTIKFGSIIADYTKIAIGCMLNTGTVIDLGSNLFSPRITGYIPKFTWGENSEKYRLDRFLQDTKKIMARRNQILHTEQENLIKHIYEG